MYCSRLSKAGAQGGDINSGRNWASEDTKSPRMIDDVHAWCWGLLRSWADLLFRACVAFKHTHTHTPNLCSKTVLCLCILLIHLLSFSTPVPTELLWRSVQTQAQAPSLSSDVPSYVHVDQPPSPRTHSFHQRVKEPLAFRTAANFLHLNAMTMINSCCLQILTF